MVNAIATPPDADRLLYAGASDVDATQSTLFRSADAGTSWVGLADAPAGETIVAIAIDPRNSLNMIVETRHADQTATLYQSHDRGANWYHALDAGVWCDDSIVFDNSSANAFIACGDRLFRSEDAGTTWVRIPSPESDVYGVASSSDGSLFAFNAEKVYRSEHAGNSWNRVGRAPVACPAIQALAVSPDAPMTLLGGTGIPTFQHLLCGGIFRSLDGGASWSSANFGGFMSDILIDPREPSRVFASAIKCCGFFSVPGGAYMSTDGGETWEDLHPPFDSAGAIALSSAGTFLYVGGYRFSVSFRRPFGVPPRSE